MKKEEKKGQTSFETFEKAILFKRFKCSKKEKFYFLSKGLNKIKNT